MIRINLKNPSVIICLAAFLCIASTERGQAATFEFGDLQDQSDSKKPELKIEGVDDPAAVLIIQSISVALVSGRFEDARNQAEQLTQSSPDLPQGWQLLGVGLANLNETTKAIDALETAAALFKNNADPLVMIGDLYASIGQADAAQQAYARAVERDPQDWRAQDSLGSFALKSNDAAKAIQYFSAALDTAPADLLELRLKLAAAYLSQEQVAPALELMTHFVDANPANVNARIALGRIALSGGDGQVAQDSFAKVVEMEPDTPRNWEMQANAQVALKDFKGAEQTLVMANEKFPKNSGFNFLLGNIYGAQQDYSAALSAYKKGLALAPDQPELLRGATRAEFRLGRLAPALAYAVKTTEPETANASDFFWLGSLQEAASDTTSATSAYERAVVLDSKHWGALNNLASLITDTDPSRAVDLARQASALVPDVPAVQDTLAWALYSAHQYPEAEALFRKALVATPDDPVTLYRLGRVLIDAGQAPDGKAMLAKALETAPDFRYAAEAHALLN